MTARNRGKLMRWLAGGSAAAGISAALISLPTAEAGLWFRSKPEPVRLLTPPAALPPATTSVAKPMQIGENGIQPVAGRRRTKRQQEQQQSQPPKEPTVVSPNASAQPTVAPTPAAAPVQAAAPAPVATPTPVASPAPIAAPTPIASPVQIAAPAPAAAPMPAAAPQGTVEDGFFLEEEMPAPPAGDNSSRPKAEFEFSQPQAQSEEIPNEQLSPIQRELKRLYEENGYQMPRMEDVTTGSRQPAGAQPRTQQPMPQPVAQPAPEVSQPVPTATPAPAVQSSKPAPAAVAAPPAASVAQPETQAEEPAPKRKGILGLFKFRKSESEAAQPPQEPRHYVPQNVPKAAAAEPQPVEDLAVEDVETTEDGGSEALNPLRARNYQNELFGPPRASDDAEEEVFVPETPEEGTGGAELGFEPESSSEDSSLPAPTEEPATELNGTESEQDPFTGAKLDDADYGSESRIAPPLPPSDDRFSAGSSTPRKTAAPTLRPAARSEATLGRSVSMKRERIAARSGQPGLKGFCPVRLRDDRELEDGATEFQTDFEGKTYYLSSAEALTKFLSNPSRYAPSERGVDVVEMAKSGAKVEGTLDHSVWYKGKLYLFATTEALQAFVASPSLYAAKN